MNASSGLGPIPATVLFAIGTGIVFLILGWVLSMTLGFRLSREKHTKLRFFLTIPFTNPLAAIVLLCKRPMLGLPGIVCYIIALMAIPVGGAIALHDEKAMMEELKRDLEEKEDPLVAEIPVNGSVPDEENLWMHPLFLPLFRGGAQDPALFGKRAIPQQPASPAVEGNSPSIRLEEILAASEMLRNGQGNPPRTWEEVAGPLLDFFEGSSNSLDRLEEALGREHAVLPFDPYHEDRRLANLQISLRNLSRSLHYRTQVQVLAGNEEAAFRLFQLNLRYARTDHPYLLITSLTQLARMTLALDTLKLAQQFHIGDEQQWRQVAEDLATLDLLPLLPRTMRMERKFFFVRHFPSSASEIIGGSGERTSNSGLFGALEFYFGDIVMATVHRSIRLTLNQYGRWIEGAEVFVGKSSTTPWDECRPEAKTGSGPLFRLALAALLNQAPDNFIKTQLLVEQARIAVALERYRLTHGAYPPSLDPLSPDFLSTDLLNPQTGAPWDYQRSEDGGFALFSGEGRAWGASDSPPPLPAPQGE